MIRPSEFYNIYRRHAKEVTNHTIKPKFPIRAARVSCLHKHVEPQILHYGLYITDKIDLIPAGVQLGLHDLSSIFVAQTPPPIWKKIERPLYC